MTAAGPIASLGQEQGFDLRYQNESGSTLLSNHDDPYDDLTRGIRDAALIKVGISMEGG
jgi:hypothetical protein